MPSESTPLQEPLADDIAAKATKGRYRGTIVMERHTIRAQKNTDVGLENFVHEPELLYKEGAHSSDRLRRATARSRYFPPNNTILGALEAMFVSDLRPATVFNSSRLLGVIFFHLTISTCLAVGYSFVVIISTDRTDFLNGTKDFADLCVTGIVFLLGGFVTTMLNRWWAFRTSCCGGLQQACTNLSLYGAALWPTNSPVHRQARALITRYSIAAYQLLFIEARAFDLAAANGPDGVTDAVNQLVAAGTLKPEEVAVLEPLPCKSAVVITWMATFWEKVMHPGSDLACSAALSANGSNGRYGMVYGQIFAARNAISLCHMYMQTQLPYGYIHVIMVVVHLTCTANSIFCGIHLGQMIRSTHENHDMLAVLFPLTLIRILRIVFVPLLLDGMLLIGSVIAMPLGDDEDDFPAGAFLESMEEECLCAGAAVEQFNPTISPAVALIKKDEPQKS